MGGSSCSPWSRACTKRCRLQCKFCSKVFSATHNRVVLHVLRLPGGVSCCTGQGEAFEMFESKNRRSKAARDLSRSSRPTL
eukprot:2779067-Pleurochrysis_carterae.AAC.1